MANEVKTPIPARLYNAAVGGHVAGADDIIDDKTGMVISELVGNKPATSEENPFNGMGVVILPMNIQEVEEDDTTVQKNILTQAMMNQTNTKYVIKYDYVLGEDITIPANCVLQFEGGSISNASGNSHTIDFNNAIVRANYKVFDSVLPVQDSEFWHEINPRWFGVIDDGVTDNISALNAMMAFAAKIKSYGVTFIGYGKTTPVIRFDTTGPIKISSPLVINTPCSIYGYPTFYYTGVHTELGGAIVLNNQIKSNTFEINVTSRLNEGTIDLSDGIQFGGICANRFLYGTLRSQEICGFNSAIILNAANGVECPACLVINPRRIKECINGVLVNIQNNGWPNEIELYGVESGGASTSVILPASFTRSAFIKFIGSGSCNSWSIHNNAIESGVHQHIESDVTVAEPMDFMYISENIQAYYFSIKDNRIENIFGNFVRVAKVSCINSFVVDFSQYSDDSYYVENHNMYYNIRKQSDVCEVMGVKLAQPPVSRNGSLVVTSDREVLRRNILWAWSIYRTPYVDVNSNWVGIIVKLKPGEVISVKNKVASGIGCAILFMDETSFGNKTSIATPNDVEIYGDLLYDAPYPDVYPIPAKISNNSIEYRNRGIKNLSTTTTYYVMLTTTTVGLSVLDAEIFSSMVLEVVPNGVKTVGETSERPNLYGEVNVSTSKYNGFEYFDTDLNKVLYRIINNTYPNGTWVDATGTPV